MATAYCASIRIQFVPKNSIFDKWRDDVALKHKYMYVCIYKYNLVTLSLLNTITHRYRSTYVWCLIYIGCTVGKVQTPLLAIYLYKYI